MLRRRYAGPSEEVTPRDYTLKEPVWLGDEVTTSLCPRNLGEARTRSALGSVDEFLEDSVVAAHEFVAAHLCRVADLWNDDEVHRVVAAEALASDRFQEARSSID